MNCRAWREAKNSKSHKFRRSWIREFQTLAKSFTLSKNIVEWFSTRTNILNLIKSAFLAAFSNSAFLINRPSAEMQISLNWFSLKGLNLIAERVSLADWKWYRNDKRYNVGDEIINLIYLPAGEWPGHSFHSRSRTSFSCSLKEVPNLRWQFFFSAA